MKIVSLTTDFGLGDPYVGAMKGMILSKYSQVQLIDLSHAIPPQDVFTAHFLLEHSFWCFPKGTIHLAIVDPGVGSERIPLIVEAFGHKFVGPDNGTFSFVAKDTKGKFWKIDADRIAKERSKTFEGRDLFAPVVGMLLKGVAPSKLGRKLAQINAISIPEPKRVGDELIGEIIYIDHFGNLVTNIERRHLQTNSVHVRLGKNEIGPIQSSYFHVEKGRPVALWDSFGRLEVAVREGSALERYNAKKGERITAQT